MPSLFDKFFRNIRDHQAPVAVLGLGYVGLPVAVSLAQKGFRVTGIDIDPQRISHLRRKRSYIPDVPTAQLLPVIDSGRFQVTLDPARLREAQVVIICVPTPLKKTREPDLTAIVQASELVLAHVRRPQLIVLESTTYPGTTEELFLRRLIAKGLKPDADFFLAFSPERIDPGNPRFQLTGIPKVVGGVTEDSTKLTSLLYQQIISKVIPVSSSVTAEMVKLLENTFRIVNIGLANEFALVCDRMGVNVWEVIEAASSKPFGFVPFYPGPGIGGHCIPSDPLYLSWKAQGLGFETRLIDVASQVNNHMPNHVVERVSDLLNRKGKALFRARILLLGVAYKPNVNDTRDSPALEILMLLKSKGAQVAYHDPHVSSLSLAKHRFHSVKLTPQVLGRTDCVVITTDHQAVDYKQVARHAPLVFDTRNAMHKAGVRKLNVVRL